MSLSEEKRTSKCCFLRRYIFRKVVVLWVIGTISLAVYINCLYGRRSLYSEIPAYYLVPQNSSTMLPPLQERLLKNSLLKRKNSLLSGQRTRHPYLLDSSQLHSTRGQFHSPFITQSDEVTQRDTSKKEQGKHVHQIPDSANKMKTKTFAVILNCMDTPPGCFVHNNYSVKTCPYNNCRQISNLEKADVVVFYTWRMKSEEYVPKFSRPPQQKWVMWTPESANRMNNSTMLDLPSLKGQFNWTMTYRLDSDIVVLYGKLRRQKLPLKNYQAIFNRKKFPAAWFVSHCRTNSERDIYVERMQKIVDVHIFGSCGTYNCSRGYNKRQSDDDVCFPMLSETYHFYLAFENSLCKDYVTEKFFKIFRDADVIPVVRGGADYKSYFPPNTFIDASDFKSPEELAKFLLDLSKDSRRYISMLKEKSRYTYEPPRTAFCDLCEKMLTDDSDKWYPDVRTWFVQDQCHLPNDL